MSQKCRKKLKQKLKLMLKLSQHCERACGSISTNFHDDLTGISKLNKFRVFPKTFEKLKVEHFKFKVTIVCSCNSAVIVLKKTTPLGSVSR